MPNLRRVLYPLITKSGKLYDAQFSLRHSNKYVFALKNMFTDIDKLNTISIETITYCNRKCSFCPKSADLSKPIRMPDDIFYKILNELKSIRFKGTVILSFYDEPLYDKRLLAFVKAVKTELGAKTMFASNGDILTPEKAREFIEIGVDQILVSQHDSEPSEHIRELKGHDWEGKIVFSVVNKNTKWLSNRGGSVKINTLHPLYCDLNHMIIRADGTVCLCCSDYYNEVNLGNVKMQSIMELWNDERYRNIRILLKKGKFNLPICGRCRGVL